MADHSVHQFFRRIADVVRRVIGVPDYERYLIHTQRCHPLETPLSAEAFATEAMVRRYSRPGNRCC